MRVNVLVALAFRGPKPSAKHHAAHDDGDRSNNRESNITWRTPKQNIADKHRHGTMPIGEYHPLNKLSREQVAYILSELSSNPSRGLASSLARQFGVHKTTVSQIKRHKNWQWLTNATN